MSKFTQNLLLLLLFPSMGEIINAKDFTINIPGSPFSLGRVTFIIVGIFGIMYNRNFFFKSNTFKGLILIFFGSIIGGLLSSQIANSVSRALGSFVLLFGSIGFARLLSNKNFRKGLDVFFVLNLAFWTFYIFFL